MLLIQGKEYGLRVFENKVLRRIHVFEPLPSSMTRVRRKPCSETE
jgi:hypothetical protein